jgi:geranylgeranyl pyrophosphate synthase
VTGYNGKRQQILAGLDVLVSDQQTRQLRIMAEAFDAASMGQVLDLLNRADEEDAKKVRFVIVSIIISYINLAFLVKTIANFYYFLLAVRSAKRGSIGNC